MLIWIEKGSGAAAYERNPTSQRSNAYCNVIFEVEIKGSGEVL
jgi:hypothetical protein